MDPDETNGGAAAPRTYDDIKALAKQLGQPIPSLLALSRKHDPFYAGTPSGWLHARWFAALWDACGYTGLTDTHLRRMHYLVVSTFPDLLTADTTTPDGVCGTRRRPSAPYAMPAPY